MKKNTFSNSSIKHVLLPSCAVRRNPRYVKCGFKERWKQTPLQCRSAAQCCPPTAWADCLGWLCETRGDTESLWHSALINQCEVRSNTLHRSHDRVERNTQAGEFYWLLGFCSVFVFFVFMIIFSSFIFNKVTGDDSQLTHVWVLPPLFSECRSLLVQMHTFKKLGNPQHSLSISTPVFHSLMKSTFSFHSRVWLKGMLDFPLDCRFHRTACWRPKVICVYPRIAVVMDSRDDFTIHVRLNCGRAWSSQTAFLIMCDFIKEMFLI